MFALTIHRDYECHRTGACCTSGWRIPVETPVHEALSAAVLTGRLRVLVRDTPALRSSADALSTLLPHHDGAPDGCSSWLGLDDEGRCLFYETGHGTCAIQRQVGQGSMPVSCRQFPRVSLADARGTFLTLSHYCPTAARLLLRTDVALGIESNPPVAVVPGGLEGLDARGTMPPLVRPGLLQDLASYDAWERGVVALLAREDLAPERALACISGAAERIRRWQPSDGALATHVEWALARHAGDREAEDVAPAASPLAAPRLWSMAQACVPAGVTAPSRPEGVEVAWRELAARTWPAFAGPVRRYLAARAFASWMAYQGQGLRTLVASLCVALGVLRVEIVRACAPDGRTLDADRFVEAVQMADLLLVHLVSPQGLADRLAEVERAAVSPCSWIEWAH